LSVRLLSDGIQSGEMPDLDNEYDRGGPDPDAYKAELREKSNAKLDVLIEDVTSNIERREAEHEASRSEKRSLSELIDAGLDKMEREQNEKEAFAKALPARDDLRSHYSDLGSLSDTVGQFLGLYESMRADPVGTSGRALEIFASSRFRSDMADRVKPNRQKVEAKFDETGRKYNSNDILSQHIENAIEASELDKADAIPEGQKKALDAVFGKIGIDKQLDMIADFNRKALADPLDAVAKLAHSLGAPASPTQLERWRSDEGARTYVNQLERAGHIPPMGDRLREAAAQVIADGRVAQGPADQMLNQAFAVAQAELGQVAAFEQFIEVQTQGMSQDKIDVMLRMANSPDF
jgi:hypothetical protein